MSGASTQFYLMSLSSISLGDINVHIFTHQEVRAQKGKVKNLLALPV